MVIFPLRNLAEVSLCLSSDPQMDITHDRDPFIKALVHTWQHRRRTCRFPLWRTEYPHNHIMNASGSNASGCMIVESILNASPSAVISNVVTQCRRASLNPQTKRKLRCPRRSAGGFKLKSCRSPSLPRRDLADSLSRALIKQNFLDKINLRAAIS